MKTIIGIDIAKSEFIIAILTNSKPISKTFFNNSQGFTGLNKYLKSLNLTQARICMEATGRYGERLADFLYELNYEVSVVNPACIKAYARTKLSRNKTDLVDATLIAEYASKCQTRPYTPKDPILKQIQMMYRCIDDLKGQHNSVTNRLETADLLPEIVIDTWTELANSIKEKINSIENAILNLISTSDSINQDFINLQTIPGIGKTSAIALLCEIPNVNNISSSAQLVAYAGLNPQHRLSGSSIKGKARISKIGSRLLRKTLYFPAIVATSCNYKIKEFKYKLKANGKHNMVIIAASMRKLLLIIFAILKNKTKFLSPPI